MCNKHLLLLVSVCGVCVCLVYKSMQAQKKCDYCYEPNICESIFMHLIFISVVRFTGPFSISFYLQFPILSPFFFFKPWIFMQTNCLSFATQNMLAFLSMAYILVVWLCWITIFKAINYGCELDGCIHSAREIRVHG